MNVEKQMEIAEEVLEKLEVFDPTCILAGGAPRDWYFGNIATDLDFFVYFRPDLQSFYAEDVLRKVSLDMNIKGGDDFPAHYKRNPHLKSVYQGFYKGETVQVMFMDQPTLNCVVDLFPFGICQAWWKGKKHTYTWNNEEIHVSRDFKASVKNKTLILLNELYNDADGYVQKIKDKFPQYSFYDGFESFSKHILYE